jgi:hypothetical protein
MSAPDALAPTEILDVARKHGISRASLEAQLKMAETEGELDVEPTLDALRALLAILGLAEPRP